MASSEIIAKLGLDASGFKSQLASAGASLTEWSTNTRREVGTLTRDVGTLKNLFALGGLLGTARAFFGEAIQMAREYKGELNENIEATKRFDATMTALGSTVAKAGVWLAGTVEKGAIGLASLVYGTEAAAEAFTRMNTAAAAALDEKRVEGIAAAHERLAKVTRDIQFSETDSYGKLVVLINEANDLKDRQRQLEKGSAEWIDAQTKLEQNLAAQRKVNAEIRKQDIEEAAKAEAKAAAETKAADEARIVRMAQLKEQRDALVEAAAREAAIEIKKTGIRNAPAGGRPGDVAAADLDFEFDGAGNPVNIRSKRGGIGAGASFGLGAMFLMGGETTFKNPAQQVIYEQNLRANTLERIDRLIAALEEKKSDQIQRMAFGGQTRNYMIDVWQQDIYALRNRRANVDSYLFDPGYSDRLGKSIPGQQIEIAGGALEDYARSTSQDIAALRRLFETGGARTASIVINPRDIGRGGG